MHPHPGSSPLGLACRFATNPEIPMPAPVVSVQMTPVRATPSQPPPSPRPRQTLWLFVHFPFLLSLLLLCLTTVPCISSFFSHFLLNFLLVLLPSCVKSSLGPIPELPLGPYRSAFRA